MSRWIAYKQQMGIPVTSIEKFKSDDVFYVSDVFSTTEFDDIFAKKGYPGAIVNDHYANADRVLGHPVPIYTAPFYIENVGVDLKELTFDATPQTLHSVNFTVNKKQINRYLTIKLVEIFDLDCTYTWSGDGRSFDMTNVIDELALVQDESLLAAKKNILSPITIEPKFFDSNGVIWDFKLTWNLGLGHVYQKSAVSLIAESLHYQTGAVFTEKTVMAAAGLTFPIWIGGYGQAHEWQQCGFDIFDDIIDHSYQYYPTLIERCWYAVKLNSTLLQNKDLLAQLRNTHLARLYNNRDLLISGHLRKHNNAVINTWPEYVQQHVLQWLDNSYRKI